MDPENPILAALLSMGRGVKEDFQEFQRRPVGFMIDAGRNFLRDPLMTHASADAFDSGHPVIGSLLAGAGAAAVIPGEAVAARAGLTRVPKPRSFPRSAGEIEAALEDEYVDALMSQAQQQVRTTTIDPNSHMIGQVAELLNNYDIPGLTEITRTRYPELRDMVIDVSSQNLEDLDDMLIDSYMDLSRQHGLSAQVRGEEETTLKLLTNLIQSERAQRAILNGDDEISRAFFEETVEPDYGLLDVLKYEGHIGGDEIINPETFFDPQFAAETLNQSRANVELYKTLLGVPEQGYSQGVGRLLSSLPDDPDMFMRNMDTVLESIKSAPTEDIAWAYDSEDLWHALASTPGDVEAADLFNETAFAELARRALDMDDDLAKRTLSGMGDLEFGLPPDVEVLGNYTLPDVLNRKGLPPEDIAGVEYFSSREIRPQMNDSLDEVERLLKFFRDGGR